MPWIYAVANQKGGVGKTTTAVNLAACVAEAGHETLVVDLDPQANATVALGAEKSLEPGVYECLAGGSTLEEASRPTAIARLALVPSTPDLAGASVELPRAEGWETRLRGALETSTEHLSYVFLDCPPSLGPLTINALAAADRVLVPVQTEFLALEGVVGLLDTVSLVQRELNPRLAVAGMILTMHDGRTRLAEDVEREMREHFPELVLRTVVPRSVRVAEAPSFGLPVTRHDPAGPGSASYASLAEELSFRG